MNFRGSQRINAEYLQKIFAARQGRAYFQHGARSGDAGQCSDGAIEVLAKSHARATNQQIGRAA